MTLDEVEALPEEIRKYEYPVQVYEGIYLGPKTVEELDDCEMFNHSCNPNAGVKGQNILIARKDIQAGEEVCFDYETTDTQGMNFICKCGEDVCRGLIDGTSWMKKEFQEKNKEFLSWYIQEKINKLQIANSDSVTYTADEFNAISVTA